MKEDVGHHNVLDSGNAAGVGAPAGVAPVGLLELQGGQLGEVELFPRGLASEGSRQPTALVDEGVVGVVLDIVQDDPVVVGPDERLYLVERGRLAHSPARERGWLTLALVDEYHSPVLLDREAADLDAITER